MSEVARLQDVFPDGARDGVEPRRRWSTPTTTRAALARRLDGNAGGRRRRSGARATRSSRGATAPSGDVGAARPSRRPGARLGRAREPECGRADRLRRAGWEFADLGRPPPRRRRLARVARRGRLRGADARRRARAAAGLDRRGDAARARPLRRPRAAVRAHADEGMSGGPESRAAPPRGGSATSGAGGAGRACRASCSCPRSSASNAYADRALPIGAGRRSRSRSWSRRCSRRSGSTGGERVLEVGTGSGYQAAVLAELADEVRHGRARARARGGGAADARARRVRARRGPGRGRHARRARAGALRRDRRRRRGAGGPGRALRAARAGRTPRRPGRDARATSGSRSSSGRPDGPVRVADRARAGSCRCSARKGSTIPRSGRASRVRGQTARRCCALPCSPAGSVSARSRTCSSTRTEPRILGLEVHCGDGASRFLPFSTARRGEHGIEIDSTFTLLDSRELEFYRAHGRPLAERARARGRRIEPTARSWSRSRRSVS